MRKQQINVDKTLPSPLKTIFWPSTMPLSTCTSRIFLSRITFLPWQCLQRSLGLIISPCPRHSGHTVWIWCNMPGPSCWTCTCIPDPLHVEHCSTAPFFPPRPSHFSQITFFCSASFLTVPLYSSSKVTVSWWTTSLPNKKKQADYSTIKLFCPV